MDGEYESDETTPDAVANFKFHVSWAYQNDGTDDEKTARDLLDTKFGKNAYNYYQNEQNDKNKAIEIVVKITSSMIHPDSE